MGDLCQTTPFQARIPHSLTRQEPAAAPHLPTYALRRT
jgi:hypothetical protein